MRYLIAVLVACSALPLAADDDVRQEILDRVARGPQACTTTEIVINGGFEAGFASTPRGCDGSSTPWQWFVEPCGVPPVIKDVAGSSRISRSGSWALYPNPFPLAKSQIYQVVQIPPRPADGTMTVMLSFWLRIGTLEPSNAGDRDLFAVDLYDTGYQYVGNIAQFSNRDAATPFSYVKKTYDMTRYAGRALLLRFWSDEDGNSNGTVFNVDDVSLSVTRCDSAPGDCTPSLTTMCLLNGRFKLEGSFNLEDGSSGILRFGPNLSDQGGVMYFSNLADPQALVKVIPACFAPFNRYWVFIGALTNQGASLTVTDTARNVSKTYLNSRGNAWSPIQDTNAFDTCP